MFRVGFILSLILLCCCGCTPTYSPPLRTIHTTAPGRTEPQQIEAGIGGNGYPALGMTWDPMVSIGLKEWLVLDVSGTIGNIPNGAMVSAGPRFQLLDIYRSGFRWALDYEVGGGGGVGGQIYGGGDCKAKTDEDSSHGFDPPDCIPGYQQGSDGQFAGGVYTGIGIGFRYKWFGIFTRARYQFSKARSIPYTHWISVVGGTEFVIAERFFITLVTGGVGDYTQDFGGSFGGPIAELGFSILFDTSKSHKAQNKTSVIGPSNTDRSFI